MKVLISFLIVFLLVFCVMAQEYREYGTKTLFNSSQATFTPTTMTRDSVFLDTALNLWVINSQTDTNNVIDSRPIEHIGGNDITITGQIDSVSGTQKTLYSFGYYTSPSYGWTWVVMDSLEHDNNTFIWNVGEQSWGPYINFTQWKIRISESTDDCAAKHSIHVVNYKP